MADPIIANITSELISSLSTIPGMSTLVDVLQALGVVIFVYFIFLIIRAITQINTSLRFKRLVKTVEEINGKLDVLIEGKTSKKEDKKRK